MKSVTPCISEISSAVGLSSSQTEAVFKTSNDNVQDLIILDSSHDEISNHSGNLNHSVIVGLSNSPQLHARSLLKSPDANLLTPSKDSLSSEDSGAASCVDAGENRLNTLIKILAKESSSNQIEEANEKEKNESASHSKLHSLLINIPNNQTHKSTNQGSAKPLAPEQLKCNILKGKRFMSESLEISF